MELLIPGLILVALMVWASTRIKKTAAAAFDAETIETAEYSIRKPEGFLHVLGDTKHELTAYSREFCEETSKDRRANIEIDVFPDTSVKTIRDDIRRSAIDSKLEYQEDDICELTTEETANQTSFTAFYKIVGRGNVSYRLRFAVATDHLEEYVNTIKDTVDSFTVKNL